MGEPPISTTLTSIMNSRRAMTAELKNVNDYLKIALDNMARGVSMFDDHQRLILCNKKYGEIYGIPDQLTKPGTPLSAIIRWYIRCESGSDAAVDVSGHLEWIRQEVSILAQGKLRTRVQELYNGRTVRISTQPLANGGWVDVQEDITEQCENETQLERLAHQDPLTDLPNRLRFREELDKVLNELADGKSLAVHLIEVAGFQPVRERLGFAVRDGLIKELAKTIAKSVASTDFAFRIDGEFFAVMGSPAMSVEAARETGRRLEAALAPPCHVYGHSVESNARVMTVFAPRDGKYLRELVESALALQPAKLSG